jgi:hypothetical protein
LEFGSLNDGAAWLNDGPGNLPAFDVLGDPVTPGVPEPGSLLLLASGMTLFAFARHRVRR